MPEPSQPDNKEKEKPAEPADKIVEPPFDPSTDTQRLRPVSKEESTGPISQAMLSERIKKLMEKAGAPPSPSAPTESLARTQPLRREEAPSSGPKAEAPPPAVPALTSKPPVAQTTATPPPAAKPAEAKPPSPAPAVKPTESMPSSSETKPAQAGPSAAPAVKPAEAAPQAGTKSPDKPQPVKPQPAPATGGVQPWRVIFQIASDKPQAVGIEVHRATVIGRSDPRSNLKPDMDLTPYNAQSCGVSRQHALLLPTDNGLNLIDLDSTNGTWINGLYLQPGVRYNLRSGDRVELGTMKLIVRVVGPVSDREIDKEVTAVSRSKPRRM